MSSAINWIKSRPQNLVDGEPPTYDEAVRLAEVVGNAHQQFPLHPSEQMMSACTVCGSTRVMCATPEVRDRQVASYLLDYACCTGPATFVFTTA